MNVIQATGAYGRKTRRCDWHDGMDFKLVSGVYFSIRDKDTLKAEGYTKIEFLQYGEIVFTVAL